MRVAADDRLDRLRLIRTANVGPVAYRQLIARFGSAGAALDALPELARRGGGQEFRIADARAAAAEMDQVARLGARHIFLGDADYPPLLAEAEGSPAALIARGTAALGSERSVAIVGARNASAAARRFARELAQEMAARGIVVVSGLARGIDTAAHVGATARRTVAVIGCGIDVVFPPENAALQDEIARDGLLLTELPPGAEPLARHFPARNRIIAWMSSGTVVVEAAPRSGSLLTARLAAKEGRDVMAVPGFPADPRAQGCNSLIREGAILVQSAEDVIEAISTIDPRAVREPRSDYTAPTGGNLDESDRRRVVGLMSMSPVAVDELIRQSGVPAGLVQTALLELEIAGRLERHAGGRVSLVGG